MTRCPDTTAHPAHRIDRGTWGVLNCPGLADNPDDRAASYLPAIEAATSAPDDARQILNALGNARFRFWTCPTPGHSDRCGPDDRPVVTVEWTDGIGRCTAPGCTQTSRTASTAPLPELAPHTAAAWQARRDADRDRIDRLHQAVTRAERERDQARAELGRANDLLQATAHALHMAPGNPVDAIPAVAGEAHLAARNLGQQLRKALDEVARLNADLGTASDTVRHLEAELAETRDLAATRWRTIVRLRTDLGGADILAAKVRAAGEYLNRTLASRLPSLVDVRYAVERVDLALATYDTRPADAPVPGDRAQGPDAEQAVIRAAIAWRHATTDDDSTKLALAAAVDQLTPPAEITAERPAGSGEGDHADGDPSDAHSATQPADPICGDPWHRHSGRCELYAPAAVAYHVTRGDGPGDLEADCPCPKEPCGSVDTRRTVAACDQHPAAKARTMRQMHRADQCPGKED